MKKLKDVLLAREANSEIVIGNSALVRAMIEAGTRVVSAYPGSPTPEIAEAIRSIPREERPFYFEFSTNEKVATELAFGAAINGHLATVFFKSVGLNVAADSFVQLGHMELIGGMVIIIGDDPGANSSQNEQDNRHYAKLSYIPMLEPASPQEAYQMYKEAANISQQENMPVILRLTTHVCHAKEKVKFASWQRQEFDSKPLFDSSEENYVPITKEVFPLKRRALKKLEKTKDFAKSKNLNTFIDNDNYTRGIITSGLPYLSLQDVIQQLDITPPNILKLGMINPLAEERIIKFLQNHEEVKILEELDDILETKIKRLAFENDISCQISGKERLEDWIGEYTPDKVIEVLGRTWPDMKPAALEERQQPLSPRPAQMCPGCGHRSAFYAIKKALAERDITVADIGCHTLGFLPPYEMGEALLSMGHSTSTGAGLSLFNEEREVVAFIGDSTLFHAGLPGIVNAVFNNHDLTLIVMENGTTAMTGHQQHPASGANFNQKTEAIPLRQVLEGLGVENIYETDTYAQKKLQQLVEEAREEKGFSVVIARHPCMLKFTREQRRQGNYKDKKVKVDQEQCQHIYNCISDFACPTFQRDEKGDISVQTDLCIGDGSCLQTCPAKAIEFVEQGGDKND